MRLLRIGTRGSKLALTQARWVGRKLEEVCSDLEVEIVTIATRGDRLIDIPAAAIEGKGLFVKEIEEALLRAEIDLAVHSLKDLPAEFPKGLILAAVPERESPSDVLISRSGLRLRDLPPGAKIGTGSLRREVQILNFRNDLRFIPIRGNIDTRLKKLDRGEVDALIMAAAGLNRLGWEDRVTEVLPPEICVSAAGQGAIGVEGREGGWASLQAAFLTNPGTLVEVLVERAFLKRLGGGCQVPIGVLARLQGNRIEITGVVAEQSGKGLLRDHISGAGDEGERLGEMLAARLLESGAGNIWSPGEKEYIFPAWYKDELHVEPSRPLLGRRVLITRARAQATGFARAIEQLGGEALLFPMIEVQPPASYAALDEAIDRIGDYHWVVFTSVNGVKYFLKRLRHLGKDRQALDRIKIAAIGPETAKAIQSASLRVDLVPEEYRAEAILEKLTSGQVQQLRILIPRAAVARDVLPETLRRWGARVDVVSAYQTVAAGTTASQLRGILLEQRVDVVTFTSPSTASHFAALLKTEDVVELLEGTAVACIGPITRDRVEALGIRVDIVPRNYTILGLTQAIVEFMSGKK